MKDLGVTQNYSNISNVENKVIETNENYKVFSAKIEEELVSSEEDELEEYYDDDFEEYIPEEVSKIEQAQEEKEAVGVFMSVISGQAEGMSPSKREAVEKALQKRSFGERSNS